MPCGHTDAQYSFLTYDHTLGLPLDEVNVIAEDSLGYIWFGGPQGLSRFDGHKFTHYYRGSPTSQPAANVVNDIEVMPNGNVVAVYDDNGISIYNHELDRFRNKTYTKSDSFNFPRYSIYFVFIENDTSAYLGANREGLYHINLKTFDSKKIPIDLRPRDMIPAKGNDGTYYLTFNGLYVWDASTLITKKISNQGFGGIQAIDNNIWYNDYGKQIIRYDVRNKKEVEYQLSFNGVIRGWTFLDGNLWVGTAEGIEIIDTSSSRVIDTLRSGLDLYDLKGNFIHDVFKDSKGRIWVSTDGGVCMHDPQKEYFKKTSFLTSQSTNLTTLPSGSMLSLDFYLNKIYNIKESKKVTSVEINGQLKGPERAILWGGEIFIHFYNGIGKYDEKTQTVLPYDCPFTSAATKGLVNLIIQDNKWLAIYRHLNMLVIWDQMSQQLDTVKLASEPRGIFSTKEGPTYIYGINLLYQYNTQTKKGQNVNQDLLSKLNGDIVQISKSGNEYWLASRVNGLWKADFTGNEVQLAKSYDEKDGLTNINIISIYVDEFENLFVQSRSNIFIYDRQGDRFSQLSGVNNINMKITHGLVAIDSMLYALGYQSKVLDLRNISFQRPKLTPIIEYIKINNQLKRGINQGETTLNYHENNIQINYTIIEFNNPQSLRTRYRIKESEPWIYSDPYSQSIHLSALDAGSYKFQLSASYGDGLWHDPYIWSFIIKPPFRRSWWFIFLSLGLTGLIGYAFFKWRINEVHKLNQLRIKLMELESASLRAQMNPHFVFNALNSIKSYIIQNTKDEAAAYLTTFAELIRTILRNSKQKEISLKSELEAVRLYLQIEKLRLIDKFDYSIHLSSNINPEAIAFPPLTIQPFVENSIWHGFANKMDKGNLHIEIERDDNKLKVNVIDNGIGRAASRKLEESRGLKRSYGISITENRLQKLSDETKVDIIDLYFENGESQGTKIIIEIPFKIINQTNK